MKEFPGYIHLEKVHEFSESIIFRAQNSENQQAVILKQYKATSSRERLLFIQKQIESIRKLDVSPVAIPIDILFIDNTITIVLEDTGLMFLSVILLTHPLSLNLFFNLSINIARSLDVIHGKQILHHDIRPRNILINEKNGEVSFTGLFLREYKSNSANVVKDVFLEEDTYIYTSPEKTGRINWNIDQRSDLYSLGVTFYEMLSGKTPFVSDDPQERIHSHLAVQPKSLRTIRQDIPPIVDQIVLKLLAKSSDDRYQSVFGLQKDLETCRNQYRSNQRIKPFELAQKDAIERFLLPSKLYGLQRNILYLLESFNRICAGSVEMVIVNGKAGMGKTSLVNELMDLASGKGGIVSKGKCEQENRDTPYFSIIGAFQSLVRRILSENQSIVEGWKARFLENLGQNGQLVIDFIPEMEQIIGPQPSVSPLEPDEAKNRLNYIFRRFIQTFSQAKKPLIIFLDRFHWADSASIQLLQAALGDINTRYVMIIIAYQEKLIVHSNTLAAAREEIEHSGISIKRIQVNPLELEDICLLIEEALSFKQDFTPLAKYILKKTEGNPYFVKQLLQTLHERGLVAFDPTAGQWVWDLKKIKGERLSGNIIKLLAEKVKNLPEESIEIMKLASCIGYQFDLNTLSLASKKSEARILNLLKKPVEEGFIKPARQTQNDFNESEKISDSEHETSNNLFQFTHSRVRQSTYSLLKTREKKAIHLNIGRILQRNTPLEEMDQNSYRLVNQMNQGIQLIKTPKERHELATLNLIAGKKSKSAAAFDAAWKYFCLGSELLTSDSWETDYELTKELYLSRSECEYFIGNTEAAEPIFDLLLQNIKTNQEKVKVLSFKLNLYVKNNRPEQAIDIGVEALRSLFDQKIPPNNAEITIVSQMKMQDIHESLDQRTIENLLFLPTMMDIDQIALMDLIASIIPAAYIVKRNLWIFLTLKMVEISLKHGNADSSAFGYMNYAVILCSGLQDYTNGHAMGRLALNLNEKLKNIQLISYLNFLFGSYIGHWRDKGRDNLVYLKRSFQAGTEHGDLLSAGLSIDFLMKTLLIAGSPLEEIKRETQKHQDFIDQLNNSDLENVLRISNLMMALRDSNPDSKEFLPDQSQSKQLLDVVKRSKNTQVSQWYYLVTAQIHFFFYHYDKALELIQESDKLIASYSQLAVPEHYFYYSLIIIENYDHFSNEEKKRYWDIIKNNHQKLTHFAKDCPINFSDKALLIEAQMARVSGNYIKASDLFDEAIASATRNGFTQNAAIANELAASYFLSKNKKTIATAYIRNACQSYIKWGATGKVAQLEKNYPTLLKKRRRFDDGIAPENRSADSPGFSRVESVIEMSQTISMETSLSQLVEKFLSTLLKNVNAQKSCLLLNKNGRLEVVAEAIKKETIKITPHSIPLEEFEDIAQSVVFYAIRTRKQVVLDDATHDGMFSYSRYIKKNNSKSILCVPVITHDRLIGILYLENTELVKTFSPKLVELLTTLVSHVAVSIENRLLHEDMDRIKQETRSTRERLEQRIQILEQKLRDDP